MFFAWLLHVWVCVCLFALHLNICNCFFAAFVHALGYFIFHYSTNFVADNFCDISVIILGLFTYVSQFWFCLSSKATLSGMESFFVKQPTNFFITHEYICQVMLIDQLVIFDPWWTVFFPKFIILWMSRFATHFLFPFFISLEAVQHTNKNNLFQVNTKYLFLHLR